MVIQLVATTRSKTATRWRCYHRCRAAPAPRNRITNMPTAPSRPGVASQAGTGPSSTAARTTAPASPARTPRARRAARRPLAEIRPFRSALLGVFWAALLLGGALLGPLETAAVVVPVAAVAGLSLVLKRTGARPWAAALPCIAAGSVIAARVQSEGVAVALVAAICLYDLSSFVMGGRSWWGRVVGMVSATVAVAGLAFLLAALADPPFRGISPWLLPGLVAVLAPIGILCCARLAGGRPNPSLCRLDSLVFAGPAWAIAARVLLHAH
jgi:hypothetical protein